MSEEKNQRAIVRSGGKQFSVSVGEKVKVDTLDAEPGDKVELSEVLALFGDGSAKVGTPLLDGAKVTASVVANGKGKKLTVFKKKRRKGYRLKKGHRQQHSELLIEGIEA